MSNKLNETFKKHLGLLHKKLQLNEGLYEPDDDTVGAAVGFWLDRNSDGYESSFEVDTILDDLNIKKGTPAFNELVDEFKVSGYELKGNEFVKIVKKVEKGSGVSDKVVKDTANQYIKHFGKGSYSLENSAKDFASLSQGGGDNDIRERFPNWSDENFKQLLDILYTAGGLKRPVDETFQRHLKLLHKKLNLNESVDINQVASTLQFKPVTKQKLVYKYVESGKPGSMSPMTYTKSTVQQPVITTTTDGKETQNTADVGDIIMSGATGENYVVKAAKLPKLYTGNVGSDIYPEQSPRQVALYSGEPVTFKAPWGEDMVIKPGDYLVKDPANTGYYRIAKVEFEKTYNKL